MLVAITRMAIILKTREIILKEQKKAEPEGSAKSNREVHQKSR
jgi:hypothetical protein